MDGAGAVLTTQSFISKQRSPEMSPSFVFPPPPPPPPSSNATNSQARPDNSDRGRHRWPTRARGRGASPHLSRGGGGRRSVDWDRPQHGQIGQFPRPFIHQLNRLSPATGQKRNHTQAFNPTLRATPLGNAPPAVPSFGLPLPIPPNLPSHDKASIEPKRKKERTFNQLGLTPRKEEHESSEEEDDADEEARLALKLCQSGLQFEHKGRLMSLNTPQEIAAWIAERKKRFPTRARIAEAAAAKAKAQQQARNAHFEQQRQRQPTLGQTPGTKKIESRPSARGREKVGQKRHLHADNVSKIGRRGGEVRRDRSHSFTRNESEDDKLSSDMTSSAGCSDASSTSSSGFSNLSESSDEGPLEQSSKVPVPAIESAKPRPDRNLNATKICRSMHKTGKCREGKRCQYRHDILSDKFWSGVNNHQVATAESQELSLYERLMAQQNDQEDREILRYIIHLGDRGLLG